MPSNEIYGRATARAEATSDAVCALLEASRKRSQMVQLMPCGEGMRFEIIDVRTGEYVRIVHVDPVGAICPQPAADPLPGSRPSSEGS